MKPKKMTKEESLKYMEENKRLVSEPGAALEVWTFPLPPHIKYAISRSLRLGKDAQDERIP